MSCPGRIFPKRGRSKYRKATRVREREDLPRGGGSVSRLRAREDGPEIELMLAFPARLRRRGFHGWSTGQSAEGFSREMAWLGCIWFLWILFFFFFLMYYIASPLELPTSTVASLSYTWRKGEILHVAVWSPFNQFASFQTTQHKILYWIFFKG